MLLLILGCTSSEVPPSNSDLLVAPDGGRDPYTEPDDDGGSGGDDTGTITTGNPDIPADVTPAALVINEVMAKNRYTLNVGGEFPDWVEVYNGTPDTVSLHEVTLEDSSGRVWMGNDADGELAPGGYLLIYADGQQTGLHAPFTIDNEGDTLTLAVDGYVVDRIATGELGHDISWARFPDGGDWAPTIWTTPDESNGTMPSPDLNTDGTIWGLYMMHSIDIELDSAAENSLRSSPTTYVSGTVTIDGEELDPVGVRIRGSSTLRTIDQKCSFKMDTNRFADLSFRGLKKVNFINTIWDAAHMREYISYYIFREFGVPSARNAYAWLTLNGEDKGIYMFSEAYDASFEKDWYGNSDGYLWEPNSGDFTSYNSWECESDTCDSSVIAPISSLLNSTATDTAVAEMETYMDLDSVLREIAVEVAVGQWDGYCSPHNYRVYWNPETGLADIMPSSVDLTFDNLGYNYGDDYFSCGGRVLSWCLSNSGCDAHYVDILNELADRLEGDDPETSLEALETLDAIDVLLDPYAADDAATGLTGYSYAQYVSDYEYIRSSLESEPDDIRRQIASH
jgi:hypothetical protein